MSTNYSLINHAIRFIISVRIPPFPTLSTNATSSCPLRIYTYLMAMVWTSVSSSPRICIIKSAPMVSYSAIPSMLMVAPIGATKRDTCGSTPSLSRQRIVVGTVAVLLRRNKKKERFKDCARLIDAGLHIAILN